MITPDPNLVLELIGPSSALVSANGLVIVELAIVATLIVLGMIRADRRYSKAELRSAKLLGDQSHGL